ncbi:MAG: toll/interleukin-1 receptor domain-containing protein [Arthrospira platensis]
MPPTVAEVVDLVVRLEDDPTRRHILSGHSHGLFQAAVEEGLVGNDGIDAFAEVIGRAVQQGTLGFQAEHAGVHLPPPNANWTNHAFQSRTDYHATLAGQQMAALYRQRRKQEPQAADSLRATPSARPECRDLFISHAREDKDDVVRPLSTALTARGWSIWVDELDLTVGDSLSGRIDAALAQSRFGVVILSTAFFSKPWPQRELSGLAAREMDGSKVILPVWHGVDHAYIAQRSPTLADRLAANTKDGIETVASEVSRALDTASLHPAADAADPAPAPWRAMYGDRLDSIFVGAHVLDPTTGQRGRVEEVLGTHSAVVRLEDGTLRRVVPG